MVMTREAALRTLGLSQGADETTVRAAYRQLAKAYHPDVNATADAGELFKEITAAQEILLGEGADAAARDESVGPAIRARWNIRRRHTPSEYPPWFKPDAGSGDGGARGLHACATVPLTPLVMRTPMHWSLAMSMSMSMSLSMSMCMFGSRWRRLQGVVSRLALAVRLQARRMR